MGRCVWQFNLRRIRAWIGMAFLPGCCCLGQQWIPWKPIPSGAGNKCLMICMHSSVQTAYFPHAVIVASLPAGVDVLPVRCLDHEPVARALHHAPKLGLYCFKAQRRRRVSARGPLLIAPRAVLPQGRRRWHKRVGVHRIAPRHAVLLRRRMRCAVRQRAARRAGCLLVARRAVVAPRPLERSLDGASAAARAAAVGAALQRQNSQEVDKSENVCGDLTG